ncbi:uncharacterized protein BDR25DRAFT_392085 [Lindgomyces ingoldianus]|uniref:Uncharacterized protein n=1 Tax=Lindgomyces ingoldianus TaxID=673940 RepID=A0ACB6R501_9PLEO|nr:uncharacterized protein BDR25DRAFT_392085 [Lindgomyces ingoldianus]KAF2474394.1 hypothetical protein BDR25DRAFT_392085 [Lindgomyces ingoldianus]
MNAELEIQTFEPVSFEMRSPRGNVNVLLDILSKVLETWLLNRIGAVLTCRWTGLLCGIEAILSDRKRSRKKVPQATIYHLDERECLIKGGRIAILMKHRLTRWALARASFSYEVLSLFDAKVAQVTLPNTPQCSTVSDLLLLFLHSWSQPISTVVQSHLINPQPIPTNINILSPSLLQPHFINPTVQFSGRTHGIHSPSWFANEVVNLDLISSAAPAIVESQRNIQHSPSKSLPLTTIPKFPPSVYFSGRIHLPRPQPIHSLPTPCQPSITPPILSVGLRGTSSLFDISIMWVNGLLTRECGPRFGKDAVIPGAGLLFRVVLSRGFWDQNRVSDESMDTINHGLGGFDLIFVWRRYNMKSDFMFPATFATTKPPSLPPILSITTPQPPPPQSPISAVFNPFPPSLTAIIVRPNPTWISTIPISSGIHSFLVGVLDEAVGSERYLGGFTEVIRMSKLDGLPKDVVGSVFILEDADLHESMPCGDGPSPVPSTKSMDAMIPSMPAVLSYYVSAVAYILAPFSYTPIRANKFNPNLGCSIHQIFRRRYGLFPLSILSNIILPSSVRSFDASSPVDMGFAENLCQLNGGFWGFFQYCENPSRILYYFKVPSSYSIPHMQLHDELK